MSIRLLKHPSIGDRYRIVRRGGELIILRAHAKQIILMDRKRVYYVEKGLVFLWEVQLDGKQALADILKQGMAAEIAGLHDASYEARVQTSTRLHIYDWEQIPDNSNDMLDILIKLREHSLRTQQLALICRQKYVSDRIHMLLSFLNNEFGVLFTEEQRIIPFALTHEDLAGAVNSSRATVTRVIHEMELSGMISHIQKGKARLIVLHSVFGSSISKLRKLAIFPSLSSTSKEQRG